jgi:hypothetical protein
LCEEKRAQLPKAPKLVLAIMPVTNTFSGSVAGIDQGLRTELHRNPGFWRSTSEYVLYAEDLGISLDGSCKRLATGAMLNQL